MQYPSGENAQIKGTSANQNYLLKSIVSELNFVEQAQRLSRNLTSLQKYSSRMSQKLEAVHHQVLQQLEELYRTEVRRHNTTSLGLKRKKVINGSIITIQK